MLYWSFCTLGCADEGTPAVREGPDIINFEEQDIIENAELTFEPSEVFALEGLGCSERLRCVSARPEQIRCIKVCFWKEPQFADTLKQLPTFPNLAHWQFQEFFLLATRDKTAYLPDCDDFFKRHAATLRSIQIDTRTAIEMNTTTVRSLKMLSSRLFQAVRGLVNLERLCYIGTCISSKFLVEARRYEKLRVLRLDCDFVDADDAVGSLPGLQVFELKERIRPCQNPPAAVLNLASLSTLDRLVLHAFRGVILAERNPNLRFVELRGVTLCDGDLSAVCVLRVSECEDASEIIAKCKPSLRELELTRQLAHNERNLRPIDARSIRILHLGQIDGYTVETWERPLEVLLASEVVFPSGQTTLQTKRAFIATSPSTDFGDIASLLNLEKIVGLAVDVPQESHRQTADVENLLPLIADRLVFFAASFCIQVGSFDMPMLEHLCVSGPITTMAIPKSCARLKLLGVLGTPSVEELEIVKLRSTATVLACSSVSRFWAENAGVRSTLPLVLPTTAVLTDAGSARSEWITSKPRQT